MARRVIRLKDRTGNHLGWLFECPGCKFTHIFDNRWTFNGNEARPTFTQSLLVNENSLHGKPRCHSFVTDGKIRYLIDSTHALAGLTVELPEF